jgi:tripartite-type tricarboxylate transporter receptor subunit TctC
MTQPPLTLIVHGPPGSAPPAMAAALAQGVAASGGPAIGLLPRGDDPGIDAIAELDRRIGAGDVFSTCTPVFLQAPLLRGLPKAHARLTPLTRMVADRYLPVVSAAAPASDLAGFLAWLRGRPSRTGGYFRGGINHLLGLDVAEACGTAAEFILVPSEPAVWSALLSGAIDWAVGTPVEVIGHLQAGSMRAIAALDTARLPRFPEVPTLAEGAGAAVSFQLWRGLIGPQGMPASSRDEVLALVRAARATAPWRDYLAANGQQDDPLEAADFARFLDEQWEWYRRQLGRAGLVHVAHA